MPLLSFRISLDSSFKAITLGIFTPKNVRGFTRAPSSCDGGGSVCICAARSGFCLFSVTPSLHFSSLLRCLIFFSCGQGLLPVFTLLSSLSSPLLLLNITTYFHACPSASIQISSKTFPPHASLFFSLFGAFQL